MPITEKQTVCVNSGFAHPADTTKQVQFDMSGITSNSPAVVTVPNASGTMALMQGASQSVIRVYTANGYGSTNTAIRRFSNTAQSQGTDITYADSAGNGGSFTINTSGVYAIHYVDQFSGQGKFGISLNSSQLTTGITSITQADNLGWATTPSANEGGIVSATVYIAAGGVVRAHTNGGITGSGPVALFSITRVA